MYFRLLFYGGFALRRAESFLRFRFKCIISRTAELSRFHSQTLCLPCVTIVGPLEFPYGVLRFSTTHERPCALNIKCVGRQVPRRSMYMYIYIYINIYFAGPKVSLIVLQSGRLEWRSWWRSTSSTNVQKSSFGFSNRWSRSSPLLNLET